MMDTDKLTKKTFGKLNDDQMWAVALAALWELKRRCDSRGKKSDDEGNSEVVE